MKDGPSFGASLLQEPLNDLAAFALDHADALCDPALGCRDFHRAWSLLRLHESGGALPFGLEFFRRELIERACEVGTGRLRVMISGAADTGQAALVVQALRPEGIEPELVVVDICRTPIEQHRIYLQRIACEAELVHGDAVEVDLAPVDAIIAHSFFGYIAPQRREALVANWARLMRPGGRLLVSERFPKESGFLEGWPDPRERAERHERLLARLTAEGYSAVETTRMIDAAERLWNLTGKRHRMGERDFRDALSKAGLRLLRFDLAPTPQNLSPIQSHAAALSRPRANVVAVKE